MREREVILRGRPDWASSEEEWILDLLREAGDEGVSREFLIFACKSTQWGRAINSLEKRGYVIEHVKFADEKYVRYILRGELLKENPVSDDWYVRQSGKPRPSHKSQPTDDLPLFRTVQR